MCKLRPELHGGADSKSLLPEAEDGRIEAFRPAYLCICVGVGGFRCKMGDFPFVLLFCHVGKWLKSCLWLLLCSLKARRLWICVLKSFSSPYLHPALPKISRYWPRQGKKLFISPGWLQEKFSKHLSIAVCCRPPGILVLPYFSVTFPQFF